MAAIRTLLGRIRREHLLRLGPGLITGVADDDPSGIATYSQAGAQFGLDLLWTMPLAYPLMSAIQEVCARIGRVTGKGLADAIRASCPPTVLRTVVLLLLIANTLNIAADIAAVGEVTQLVSGVNRYAAAAIFAVGSTALQIFVPYHRYVHFLKWLCLSLLAYAAVLFTVHVPWAEVAARTVWPHLTFDSDAAEMVVGVFGTTISPYLFFWQASEEVEDMRRDGDEKSLIDQPAKAPAELGRIAWDTWGGMFYSDLSAYFIILATAVTLHVAGVTDIDTAAQAASALAPLAGKFAALLFAIGVIGVGLIGVPVLAGSGAYAMAETMGWNWGLEMKLARARGFYAVIGLGMLAALAIQFLPVNPMRALVWSAVINGIVAVPLMAVILITAARKSVMGNFTENKFILALGWIAVAVMGAAAVMMVV
jgi:NRAMP (natural resistance-associated macrophage protein)-like metal ion transporter